MKLIYIHGHGATPDSFNFIRSELGWSKEACLGYDSKNGFSVNYDAMFDYLKDEQNIFFIAHSLGGVYALHLAERLGERVRGAVTMATPYGGSESALALNFFSPQQVYKDIHPSATPITKARNIELHADCRWTAIVTTSGHSQLMGAANDGIVTRDSMMMTRCSMNFIDVESNHHEVVQARKSLEIIRSAIIESNLRKAA